MIYQDRQGRPFILDGDRMVLVSECHDVPLIAEPILNPLWIFARGGNDTRLAVCTMCGAYAEHEGENFPATDEPDAALADVREQLRYAEQENQGK